MNCLICVGQAESVECANGWHERFCLHCGRYRMSQALILLMMDEGQIFDTGKMRIWLDKQRDFEEIPTIGLSEAIWVHHCP